MKKLLAVLIVLFLLDVNARSQTIMKAVPAFEQVNGEWSIKTLASMTLREKIGQLFMVATASSFEQPEEALASQLSKCPYNMAQDYIKFLISEYKIGGLIFLFKSTPEQQIRAVNEYQQLSKTPLMIGQDCEWGLSMRLYNTIRFPRNMTLGALNNKQLIYELGKEIGQQCKAIGVHINFSPVVDVNNNPDNPVIHDRSFGADPTMVAQAGLHMMQGLQDAGIIACAKHFPGHGDTAIDSHFDLPVIPHTKEHLKTIEFVPFKKLIDHGVCAIMNAHLALPELEKEVDRASSLSRTIVTQILEKELGFRGLKITDGMGMEALTRHCEPGTIELEAFLAGNDILLCPLDVPRTVELIEQAIKDGKVTEDDLNARVLKILKAKEWAGCHTFASIDPEIALNQLRSPHGLHLKEQLYNQAITVIGKESFEPISSYDAKTIAIIQIGGEQNNDFKKYLQKNTMYTYYFQPAQNDAISLDALLAEIHQFETFIIPIFQMHKFAKQQFGISDATRQLYEALSKRKKRIIVVPFGTPYTVSLFAHASSIIIAYENVSEAQKAVVDVLLGNKKATGQSPVTFF